MAATLAEGETRLINAAREPEITDLAHCLVGDGGADRRHRHRPADDPAASRSLHGAHHTVIPDRIETGTYMMAAAATGGEVRLVGGRLDQVDAVRRMLDAAGVCVSEPTARSRCGGATAGSPGST